MPNKPGFLTEPQWQLLTAAVSEMRSETERGKVSTYYTNPRSLETLLKHQMIEHGYDVRTTHERHQLGKRLEDSVTDATHFLELGDWRQALRALKVAEAHAQALEKKAYWVTESALSWLT